jgi:molybdate transport system substrate-binding protein
MFIKFLSFMVAAAFLACAQPAAAEDVHVLISGGIAEAYKKLAPEFEKKTGHHLIAGYGSSMGETETAIPVRLDRGDPVDVVLMVRDGLPKLQAKKQIQAGSVVDLAVSKIAMAVREGAPVPDISTVDALKQTLLAAKSVALSDSASGHYILEQMYTKMGIDKELGPKSRMIPATPVGEIVAAGQADLGFQQYSELVPVKGIHVVGRIPDGVQKDTLYIGAITTLAKAPDAAKALIQFLQTAEAQATIRATGIEPIAVRTK